MADQCIRMSLSIDVFLSPIIPMLLLLPGQISAKALWDALRQRSLKILDEMGTETSEVCH